MCKLFLRKAILLFFAMSCAVTARAADRLQIFRAPDSTATGRAVLILPGGGYRILSMQHEGTDWVPFFHSLGITVAVLGYSMPDGDRNLPVGDALDAMSYLRTHAADLGVNPAEIGIMGFSAGGHLATVIATQAPADLRPDFQVLFYPVVSMMPGLAHRGSHDALLGADAPDPLERAYSSELNVDSLTPRGILLLSADDKGVDPANSISYFEALRNAGVPASLHIYPSGGHGWGLCDFPWMEAVLDELQMWLRSF